jgi:hypothetical protein
VRDSNRASLPVVGTIEVEIAAKIPPRPAANLVHQAMLLVLHRGFFRPPERSRRSVGRETGRGVGSRP